MEKIKVTLRKSMIGSTLRQKRTLHALGLRKISATNELDATPQVIGMINKVQHLVSVDNNALLKNKVTVKKTKFKTERKKSTKQ